MYQLPDNQSSNFSEFVANFAGDEVIERLIPFMSQREVRSISDLLWAVGCRTGQQAWHKAWEVEEADRFRRSQAPDVHEQVSAMGLPLSRVTDVTLDGDDEAKVERFVSAVTDLRDVLEKAMQP